MSDIIKKSLSELALDIPEYVYREDPALSYSTIARYEKGGFSSIPKLFDPVESDAITFGSVVDTLITEGKDTFDEKFYVADFVLPTESVQKVLDNLLDRFAVIHLEEIEDSEILEACDTYEYQMKWKPETRVAKIRELGTEYFNTMQDIGNRTIISSQTYSEAVDTVLCLKSSSNTGKYLHKSGDYEHLEFLYQQKFKTNLDGLDVRMMADLLVVNHADKIVIPIDLKTTSIQEYNFPYKYLENHYDIQARLYWRILRTVMDNDEYFKDFKLFNFRFMVINKDSLNPLMFTDEHSDAVGDVTITYKSGRTYVLRDPVEIGKELRYYLDSEATVPDGINKDGITGIYERLSLL